MSAVESCLPTCKVSGAGDCAKYSCAARNSGSVFRNPYVSMACVLLKLTTRKFAPTDGMRADSPPIRPTLKLGGSADCGETKTLTLTMPLSGRFGLAMILLYIAAVAVPTCTAVVPLQANDHPKVLAVVVPVASAVPLKFVEGVIVKLVVPLVVTTTVAQRPEAQFVAFSVIAPVGVTV